MLRDDPSVSPRLWELLEAVVDRLEGPFAIEEVPTRPERKPSRPGLAAVTEEIFKRAKGDPEE